eukprot:TRINITY_DN3318_c0_g1_i14.p1 TRINITY_DN3318_c0_g1~~TRINITY_DN3318_c0_g1_i14.p1  ORF type:complete len:205 (+),score=17.65 TRINITY_DN3318_c0_g1_i14:123-737(+)
MLELTIPSPLLPVILLLENSAGQEEREEAARQLKALSETTPELEALLKGQALGSAEPREVAKKLREYYEQKITPAKKTEASFSCSLDLETTENIRRELRKTYKENNINFIANGTSRTTSRMRYRIKRAGAFEDNSKSQSHHRGHSFAASCEFRTRLVTRSPCPPKSRNCRVTPRRTFLLMCSGKKAKTPRRRAKISNQSDLQEA